MKTAYKVWMYFFITLVMWSVAMVIPSGIYAFFYESGVSLVIGTFFNAIFMILFLVVGWYFACKISKGKFSTCIKANLYIFSVIEGFEFLNLIPEIMEMITRTGQYSVDPYGIPYSDYPSIYIPAILFIVLYIAIDIYLAEKTTQLDKCCSKESVKRFDFYKRFLPCSLATLCFWALIFLGPVIILLINNVNYYFNGTGYGPGSIMYSVLQFISQPTACVIAAYAADAVSKNQHKICVIVNCYVCALVCLLLALVEFLDKNTLMLFTFVVSAVASFIASYQFIKEIWEEQNKTQIK